MLKEFCDLNFYIVIPAHNEEDFIASTLESLTQQSLLPSKVVVVNDNSTDKTEEIVNNYTSKYDWISIINSTSSNKHLPGSKIINAFYKGYETLDANYDIICKFDADLIFPSNYLESLSNHFHNDATVGMAAGFCYIEKNSDWFLEDLTNKDHIRGALKAYRKQCFIDIGKLKPSMGWDTVDELLAKFYDWKIVTDEYLHVKHLKPTGKSYNKASKYLQGESMYKLRYGFWLTFLSALKLAYKKGSIRLFKDYIKGYFNGKSKNLEYLVTSEQGKFIRNLRWQGIKNKFK